jgi:hypothetical protein
MTGAPVVISVAAGDWFRQAELVAEAGSLLGGGQARSA